MMYDVYVGDVIMFVSYYDIILNSHVSMLPILPVKAIGFLSFMDSSRSDLVNYSISC